MGWGARLVGDYKGKPGKEANDTGLSGCKEFPPPICLKKKKKAGWLRTNEMWQCDNNNEHSRRITHCKKLNIKVNHTVFHCKLQYVSFYGEKL